jgi:hypothetical protein
MSDLNNENYIEKLYEEFNTERNKLMTDLKKDKECEKEKVITSKILCLDNLMRNILKFRNICIKDKLKGNL